ncbi:MAG: ABC transporter substrate-binding protein [Ignavibacteria bacterium]|nr:ABC transporter substrate-binding protein [Ignavibacteria bacterium]
MTILKRLSLGLILITLSASVLLLSDWNRRVSTNQHIPRLAIIQHASQTVLDEGVDGMIQGLTEMGFTNGQTLTVQRYNAENDMPTANAIAVEVVNGHFDLLMTASTLSLQTVARANKRGTARHVFALVSDPFGAGVGISRDNPLDHPAYLVGYGTMQPVEKAFRIAKRLLPTLSTVGVAWNPGESNSEANILVARRVCQQLGITLVEAAIENSSGVFEAASSLISKGVQALWVGGDLTVIVAFDAVQRAADTGKVPVFTNIPPLTKRGALFDLGANYHEVGRQAGLLAGQVLLGADPSTIPIINMAPEKLIFNSPALTGLREPWEIPQDLLAQADTVITAGGAEHTKTSRRFTAPPGRTFTIGVVYFGPDPVVESGLQGFIDGLAALQFIEGKNITIKRAHAQGEMVNIPTIIQSYLNQDVDLIVPLTTPALTAASGLVKTTPVVFSVVYDPIAAGAGKTRTDHLPNVTGVGSFPPVADTVALIKELVPNVKAVGTLYNSSEANSRKVISVSRPLFKDAGITLEEVAIGNSSEVYQAAQALATRDIQALWITGDNTAFQAFEGIVKVAEDFSLPLIINDPEFTKRGALACQGLGFYKPAYVSATLAARVLLGESPQDIPFEEIQDQQLCLNFEVAKRLGKTFPEALIHRADLFYNLAAKFGRPARITWLRKDSPIQTATTLQDMIKSLTAVGLIEGTDFVIQSFDEKTFVSRAGQDKTPTPDLYVTETTLMAHNLQLLAANTPVIALDAADFQSNTKEDTSARAVARSLALITP